MGDHRSGPCWSPSSTCVCSGNQGSRGAPCHTQGTNLSHGPPPSKRDVIKSAWGLRHAKQWGSFFEEKRFTLRRNIHEEPVPDVRYQGHTMPALQKGRTVHGGQGSASRLGGWRPRRVRVEEGAGGGVGTRGTASHRGWGSGAGPGALGSQRPAEPHS